MPYGEQLQGALDAAEWRRTEIELLIDQEIDFLREVLPTMHKPSVDGFLRHCRQLVSAFDDRDAVDAEIMRLLDPES
jgi:hypothetical protein